MDTLETIVEEIRAGFEIKNAARDAALQRSRTLTRHCANAIRAAHRGEFADAQLLLETAGDAARAMIAGLTAYPDLYHAGYTQDSLKEYAEARLTYAFITDGPVPRPLELGGEPAAFLKGLAEAASEMRRYALDLMRHGSSEEMDRAGHILDVMDEVYTLLITVDFPDAVTGGLRHTTDALRGVLERTRGDLATAMRQEMMRQALAEFEGRLGIDRGP
jgi:translin